MGTVKKSLEQFHQHLYEKARDDALSYPGYQATQIKNYASNYHLSLPKSFKESSLDTILKEIEAYGTFLYGDFHTLKQSQKGFVRIIKELTLRRKDKKIILCLEMFKYKHQETLNQYLEGSLEEDQFLKEIEYKKEWGFPWEHYRLIIQFAKTNNINIIGINTENGGKDNLHDRDAYGAEVILQTKSKYPDALIGCLIGEYHLGDQALVNELKKHQMTVLRIFTNVDEYYFSRSFDPSNAPEYLYLKPDSYCILNSPPWIKWQSYCLWEEMKTSQENSTYFANNDEYLHTDDGFDIDFQVHEILNILCTFLDISVSNYELCRFNVKCHPNHLSIQKIKSRYNLTQTSIDHAFYRLDHDGFFFEENSNSILLSVISYNNIAKVAGQYIYSMSRHYPLSDLSDLHLFFYRCLIFASGEVSAKFLNPRIRSYTLSDYRTILESNKSKNKSTLTHKKREAIKLAMTFFENIPKGKRSTNILSTYQNQDRSLCNELSLAIGSLIGYALYKDATKNNSQREGLKHLFYSSSSPERITEYFFLFLNEVINSPI